MCSRSSIAARVARRVLVRLLPVVGLALVGAAGCSTETSDDDDLRALLHDEPVTQIAQSALSSETGAGGTTGTGTGTGGGGTPVGMAGNSGDAGAVMTGAAGSTGAPDAGVVGGSRGTVDGGLMGVAGFTGTGGSSGPAGRGGPAAGATGTGNTMGIAGVTGRGGSGPGGRGGSGPMPGFGQLGQWNFDDCSSFRTNLLDSSGQNNTAFRAVNTACGEGISGMAVALNNKDEDLVYVPDQPTFTFNSGVTVAGWFAHTSTNQTRTLFRKREAGSNSSFALVLNNGKYQFVVDLGSTLASVTAPTKAKANEWTHVGATYDGNTLRLYVGGVEIASKAAIGTILGGSGPLLMGNDGSKRLMAGRMDQAVFAARAFNATEMNALTCLRRAPSIAGTPAVSAPTPAGTPASFDIALTNNDTASCSPADYVFQVQNFNQGINVQPSFTLVSVPSGTTGHIAMTATASDDVDSGTFPIQFLAFQINSQQQQSALGRVDFVVVQSGCRVSTPRELMITNLGVVDNVRAFGDGVWSFKHLMEAMAPTPEDAPAMVEQMLTSFMTNQTVNGFDIGPRPGMQQQIDFWPRTPDGKLDLGSPLVQLNAIVNRFDLRNLAAGDAGEGRFVFSFLFPNSPFPRQATIILEYKLPATTPEDVMAWANAWHGLGSLTPGSEDYNAALEVITERFAGRGMRPGRPNGNAVNAVRTNEIDFGFNGLWELREFVLSAETGMLVPATIKLTPDLSFNFGDKLGRFVNANEASILTETHDVPETFEGEHFLGGAVFNDLGTPWFAFNITNNEARHKFALNTCNGCHAFEAGVSFLQISPRFPGGEAGLSGFLTGTTVSDPVTGQQRSFNDLGRRRADLKALVCPTEPQPVTMPGGTGPRPAPSPTSNIKLGTLAKGLSRVH